MSEVNPYYPLWKKYVPVIKVQMKNAKNGQKEITLHKGEFQQVGKRKVSDYTFNLEIFKGKVVPSKIKGITVARDLYETLLEDATIKQMLIENDYKIHLGKDYMLKINLLTPHETVVPVEVVEAVEEVAEVMN